MSDNPENLPARIDNSGGTLALIKTAIDKGIDPEALGKLLDLQDRVLAKQAESEFTQAKKKFQARCPVINKNRHADIKGGAKYSFADLENITQTIRPLLEEHGFSWSFTQRHNGDIVEVVCILKHESGHKEETSFSAPWTTNAGMSPMQKYASMYAPRSNRRLHVIEMGSTGIHPGERDSMGRFWAYDVETYPANPILYREAP